MVRSASLARVSNHEQQTQPYPSRRRAKARLLRTGALLVVSQSHLPGGEVLHDLLAAAADRVHFHLAVDALDLDAAHKTGAAENLHRLGGAERHGLRGLILQHA